MVFTPNLSILPPPQLRLWSELDATPEAFTLYGGTALALRLGHRTSVDFDFFSISLLIQMILQLLFLISRERSVFRLASIR